MENKHDNTTMAFYTGALDSIYIQQIGLVVLLLHQKGSHRVGQEAECVCKLKDIRDMGHDPLYMSRHPKYIS